MGSKNKRKNKNNKNSKPKSNKEVLEQKKQQSSRTTVKKDEVVKEVTVKETKTVEKKVTKVVTKVFKADAKAVASRGEALTEHIRPPEPAPIRPIEYTVDEKGPYYLENTAKTGLVSRITDSYKSTMLMAFSLTGKKKNAVPYGSSGSAIDICGQLNKWNDRGAEFHVVNGEYVAKNYG